MNKKVVYDNFDKSYIFRSTFLNRIQSAMCRVMDKAPKGQKYRLVLEPIEKDEKQKTCIEYIQEYLDDHQPTSDEIERLKEIPPDDLKQMMKAWWDEFIVGGMTDDSK